MLVEHADPCVDLTAELPGVLQEGDLPITNEAIIAEEDIPGVAKRCDLTNAGLLEGEPLGYVKYCTDNG